MCHVDPFNVKELSSHLCFQAIRAAHAQVDQADVELAAEAAGLQPPRAQTAFRKSHVGLAIHRHL